jgi:hypothetical protein
MERIYRIRYYKGAVPMERIYCIRYIWATKVPFRWNGYTVFDAFGLQRWRSDGTDTLYSMPLGYTGDVPMEKIYWNNKWKCFSALPAELHLSPPPRTPHTSYPFQRNGTFLPPPGAPHIESVPAERHLCLPPGAQHTSHPFQRNGTFVAPQGRRTYCIRSSGTAPLSYLCALRKKYVLHKSRCRNHYLPLPAAAVVQQKF